MAKLTTEPKSIPNIGTKAKTDKRTKVNTGHANQSQNRQTDSKPIPNTGTRVKTEQHNQRQKH